MPDYKRLVSYMYNYEDGIKKNNVGYARVEARNGQCKCTLHIAAPSLNDKQLKVYIFKRRKDGLEGILLGTLQVKNGMGDYKTVTDSVHIMNSSYSLDDMGGIVLYLTERKFFATSWDDAPITMDLVNSIESGKYEKEIQAAAVYVTRLDKLAKSTGNSKEAVIIKNVFPEPEKSAEPVKEQDKKEPEESAEASEAQNKREAETPVESSEEQDRKEPEDSIHQVEQQELLEEPPNNEGEVFNDFADGKEAEQTVLNTETEQKEVTVKEVGKDENQKDNENENKEDLENKKEEEHDIASELNAPVEILQKEELLKEESPKQVEETYFSDENSFNEPVESGDFNTEPQTIAEAKQSEIQGEECQKDSDRQPFFEDHPLAKRIYRSFPRMYPFEDNEIAWCVRIEPQDIGLFPMEAWILGNNSFLLHGYYSYRHLIFARMNDKNGFSYILGVPGIYHNREKFMARMFGFENFKCVKRKVQRTGEFGYWYIPITLN